MKALVIAISVALVAAAGAITLSDARSSQEIATEIIAKLLDPAKVATVKHVQPDGRRLFRVLYWLETARQAGGEPEAIIETAQVAAAYAGSAAAKADKAAIVASWQRLVQYGCFSAEGMAELRKGRAPMIAQGAQRGVPVALMQILPCEVVPELSERYFNIGVVPACQPAAQPAQPTVQRVEIAKEWRQEELAARSFGIEIVSAPPPAAQPARLTAQRVEIARGWCREGLLSAAGLRAVESAGPRPQNECEQVVVGNPPRS